MINRQYSKTIKLKVDPELFKRLDKEAKKFDTDVPTYIKWCIQTGLYLDELNAFVKSRGEEPE